MTKYVVVTDEIFPGCYAGQGKVYGKVYSSRRQAAKIASRVNNMFAWFKVMTLNQAKKSGATYSLVAPY